MSAKRLSGPKKKRLSVSKQTKRELGLLLERIVNPEQVAIGVSKEIDLDDYIQNEDGSYTHAEHYRKITRSRYGLNRVYK